MKEARSNQRQQLVGERSAVAYGCLVHHMDSHEVQKWVKKSGPARRARTGGTVSASADWHGSGGIVSHN